MNWAEELIASALPYRAFHHHAPTRGDVVLAALPNPTSSRIQSSSRQLSQKSDSNFPRKAPPLFPPSIAAPKQQRAGQSL